MEHTKFLINILKMNPLIRFAGVYNENFEKLLEWFQPGTLPILSLDEMENSVRYDIRRWETYRLFEKQLGDSKFALVKYGNAILITFALIDNKFLRISTEPDVDYKKLIDEILEIISKNPILK